jgi:hypothetical protein
VWLPVLHKVATLQEIGTYWTLYDCQTYYLIWLATN